MDAICSQQLELLLKATSSKWNSQWRGSMDSSGPDQTDGRDCCTFWRQRDVPHCLGSSPQA